MTSVRKNIVGAHRLSTGFIQYHVNSFISLHLNIIDIANIVSTFDLGLDFDIDFKNWIQKVDNQESVNTFNLATLLENLEDNLPISHDNEFSFMLLEDTQISELDVIATIADIEADVRVFEQEKGHLPSSMRINKDSISYVEPNLSFTLEGVELIIMLDHIKCTLIANKEYLLAPARPLNKTIILKNKVKTILLPSLRDIVNNTEGDIVYNKEILKILKDMFGDSFVDIEMSKVVFI